MTFLIATGSIASRVDVEDLDYVEESPMEVRWRGPRFWVFSTRDLHPTGRDNEVGLFEGYGFTGKGRLFHASAQLWSKDDAVPLHSERDDLDGVFCIVEVDLERSTLMVSADKLGNYPVFYFRAGREWAVSDDLNLLHGVAGRFGLACKPRPVPVAMHTVWGTGFAPETIYENIWLTPSRHGLRLDADGEFRVFEARSRQSFLSRYTNYDDAIADIKSRLTRRCQGIVEQIDPTWCRVVDISGGQDSRVTLAGFLGTGNARDMRYHSRGEFDSDPDRMVGDLIISRFDLSPGPYVWSNSRRDYSFSAALAARAHRMFGLKTKLFTLFGELRLENYCRVTGFLGEYSKAVGAPLIKGAKPGPSADETVEAVLGAVNLKRALLTADGFAEIKKRFHAYYAELYGDVAPSAVNSFVYSEQKGRFHFGVNSAVTNKFHVSLDPLGDPNILSAVDKLSYPDQKRNRVGFDVIHGLGGEALARIPFAGDRWPPRWMGADATGAAGVAVVRNDTVPDWRVVHGDRTVEIPTQGDPVTLEIDREIERLSRHEALSELDRTLLVLADMVPADDEFWGIFDRDLITAELLPADTHRRFLVNKENLAIMLMLYLGIARAPRQNGAFAL